MTTRWTEEQRHAIETHDRNLLVSAAAGSGKTAVLAERCAYLVCDAQPPCDADELLVVTFTNAAAEEMRKRISQALTRRAAESADPRLQKQPLLLSGAQISTIHTLCSSIIRRNFHRLGLDPNFRLMDEDEAKLLRRDVAEGLLDERFDDPDDHAFRRLIDEYAGGHARGLRDRLLTLHARLSSLLDPKGWLAERRQRIVEAIEQPLANSAIGRELLEILKRHCETLTAAAERLAAAIGRTGVLPAYVDHVNVIAEALREWQQHLATRPFDQAADIIKNTEWPRLPRGYTGEEKERYQKRIDELKKRIKRYANNGAFLFTEDELREGLSKSLWAVDRLTDLVNDFDAAYTRAKRGNSALDFNDLERLAIQLLRDENGQPTPVALEYRGQFRHVLVDEYQDVNELQDTLLSLIANEDQGNLFCVGDVKQSIYRFRHADPQRFIRRYGLYKRQPASGEVIDLNRNFRSRGPLLETLNLLFEALITEESAEVDYDESQRLVPGTTFPSEPGLFTGAPIELHVIERQSPSDATGDFDTEEREALLTAARIREMLGYDRQLPMHVAERGGQTRPIRPSDIAVLLRTVRIKAERFASILQRADIPVQADSTTGFFSSTEVGDILVTLRLIDSGRRDYDLAAYLRSPLANLSAPEDIMATVRLAYPRKAEPMFHRAVVRYARDKTDVVAEELKRAMKQLEHWRELSRERSVAELLWTICDETSYLPWCSGLPDGEQRVANLLYLHERAQQFEQFRRPTLNRFLHFIESLQDESDLGMPPVAGANLDAVRIMSVHRSKGLEFPVVILPDLAKGHNLSDTMGTIIVDDTVGIGLRVVDASREAHYPSMASMVAQHHARRRSLAEELRVLYVAGTRAREHLILIGTTDPDTPQAWDESYIGHTGPIAGSDVHEGGSMLEWIGPASSIAESRVPGSFVRQVHSVDEIESLGKSMLSRPQKSDVADRIARLEPLGDSTLPQSARVKRLIDRLSRPYKYEELTTVPAVSSVTRLTKDDRFAPAGSVEMRQETVPFNRVLRLPTCIAGDVPLSGAEIGSATHIVLQRLDLSRACDDADVESQIRTMVARRFLTEKQAKAVDREAIRWWLGTPLARRLCARPKEVLNELELTYMQPAENAKTPDDNIMVRGRLDAVLIDEDGQLVVIDYKTDRVTPDTVPARTDFYRPQVHAYREHLARVAARTVKEAYLVFLTARMIVPVEG